MSYLELAVYWHSIYALYVEAALKYTALSDETVNFLHDAKTCYLGRWMSRADAAMAARPEFQVLAACHDRFHAITEQLIDEINRKSVDHAHLDAMIEQVRQASRDVMAAIVGLGKVLSRIDDTEQLSGDLAYDPACPLSVHEVGIPVIDLQHRTLARMAKSLVQHPESRLDDHDSKEFLAELVSLTDIHFRTEEIYMRSIQLPPGELQRHISEHQRILKSLLSLSENAGELQATASSLVPQLFRWFSDHLIDYDYSLKKF